MSNQYLLLDLIHYPTDLKKLNADQLPQVCAELRAFLIETILTNGGHFAANLLSAHCQNPLLTIGSHTHLHFNLGNLTPDLVEMELNTPKRILEDLCQYEINSIAYPDGSYNEDVKKMALQCGYTQQLAVDFKLESDWDDKHILRRYSYSNSTTHEVNMLKMGIHARKYKNI